MLSSWSCAVSFEQHLLAFGRKVLRQTTDNSLLMQKLSLTGLQKEQLKLMRQNHLRNLRAVYEARQQLNMQVLACTLPIAMSSCFLNFVDWKVRAYGRLLGRPPGVIIFGGM